MNNENKNPNVEEELANYQSFFLRISKGGFNQGVRYGTSEVPLADRNELVLDHISDEEILTTAEQLRYEERN